MTTIELSVNAQKLKSVINKVYRFIENDIDVPALASFRLTGTDDSKLTVTGSAEGVSCSVWLAIDKPLNVKLEVLLPRREMKGLTKHINKKSRKIRLNIKSTVCKVFVDDCLISEFNAVRGVYPQIDEAISYTKSKGVLFTTRFTKDINTIILNKLKKVGVFKLKNFAIWLSVQGTDLEIMIRDRLKVDIINDTQHPILKLKDYQIKTNTPPQYPIRIGVNALYLYNVLNISTDSFNVTAYRDNLDLDYIRKYPNSVVIESLEFTNEVLYVMMLPLIYKSMYKYPSLYTP